MPQYEFWYTEAYTYKAWFTAKNIEEAYSLMAGLEEGNYQVQELPEFVKKDKGYEIDFDPFTEVL
jgi:hypothetical protein